MKKNVGGGGWIQVFLWKRKNEEYNFSTEENDGKGDRLGVGCFIKKRKWKEGIIKYKKYSIERRRWGDFWVKKPEWYVRGGGED